MLLRRRWHLRRRARPCRAHRGRAGGLARQRARGGAEAQGEVVVSRAVALKLGADHGPAVREARAPTAASGAIRDASDKLLPYAPRVNAFAGRRTGRVRRGARDRRERHAGALRCDGLRGARREVAAAIERAALTELDRARLEGAANCAARLARRPRGAGARCACEPRRGSDAEEIARVANARVDRGVAMPAEASLAAAEVGAAVLGERDAEGLLVAPARRSSSRSASRRPTAVVAAGELPTGRRAHRASPAPSRASDPRRRARRDRARARRRQADRRAHGAPDRRRRRLSRAKAPASSSLTGTLSVPLPFLDATGFDAARQQASVLSAEARAAPSARRARPRRRARRPRARAHARGA